MKKVIFSSLIIFSLSSFIGHDDSGKITEAVNDFVSSADSRDASKMEQILHKDFRAIVNRLFGSEEVSVMDKSSYIGLLKAGKIGGDNREVIIESINFEGNNATVRAKFIGQELEFSTFLQLVKGTLGDWKIISDMPNIKKR